MLKQPGGPGKPSGEPGGRDGGRDIPVGKPPAPLPVLEPVIPQPYVPPVGGEAVEWHHKEGDPDPLAVDKTRPTVIETPDGVRHYTPDSALWWSLGMRTSKDYDKYLRTGEPSQYVGITKGVDKPMLVSRALMIKAFELKGVEQFKALKEAGVIPFGSKFVPDREDFQGPNWSYIHPDTIRKFKARVLKDQVATKIEPGVEFFEENYTKLHGQWFLNRALADLKKADLFAYNTLVNRGYAALEKVQAQTGREIREFERTNTQLPDGAWVDNKALAELKEVDLYAYNTLKNRGFAGFVKVTKADEARRDAIIAQLDEKFQVDGGYNLPLALKSNVVTAGDLKFVGFEKKDIDAAVATKKVSIDTSVAVAGERNWLELQTGKIYSDVKYQAIIAKTPVREFDFVLTPASGRRLGIQVASFVAPATRAALPEYTVKDISAVEWGLTGVNVALLGTMFAPGAIMGSLAGRVIVTGITTTGAGLLGYTTAKHWDDLSTTQRVIGVGGTMLYALPMMVTLARGVKLSSVQIPTAKGQAVAPPVWKGLSVMKNPVIGRSGGKWVIGGRNITLPEARLIAQGYKPEMMLDTKVFVNPKALSKAGFSETQIKFLLDSLKVRNLLAGKRSPFLSKDVLLEPTAYITSDEMAVWLRQIAKYNKKIKKVDMLYGGGTIKAQLAPELRGWRQMHDLDMHTTFTLPEGKTFILDTLKLLRRLPGKGKYRVSPKSPIRIEKLVKGKWEHMNDLKSEAIDPSLQVSELPGSSLDVTGAYSYGRMVAEPAITVKYPGIGKFDIMALSESGVRKADTILRVRQTEIGTAFRPPERGIARPGVPKDAADFYVILQTYEKGGILKLGTADEWLGSWAKSMGYSVDEAARLMPTFKKAIQEVASNTPSNLIGYSFTPSKTTKVSSGASPTITIAVPSSLGASISPSLERQISTPVSLYSLSPTARASISATVSGVVPSGYPTMVTLSTMKGLSPSEKASVSASASPQRVSPVVSPSPSPKPSPEISPLISKISPIISPVLSPKPSPTISPVPSPKPSPVPSPVPSPEITPVVPEPEKPEIVPTPKPPTDKEKRKAIKKSKGAIAWRHGELKGKDVWHVIMSPYASEVDHVAVIGRKPPNTTIVKGPGSAFQTVKLLYGTPPSKKVTGDIGFFDFSLEPKGTDKIGIGFTPDPKLETTGDITIGRKTPPITERPVGLGRGKSPRITPKTPRLRR